MLRKTPIAILFIFSFLFLCQVQSFAQVSPTASPTVSVSPSTSETEATPCGSATGDGFGAEICPGPLEINGNTPSVKITFSGLPDREWRMCSKEYCSKAEDKLPGNTIEVCAANENTLRVNDCDDGDYFHEGKVYYLSLFEDEDQEIRGPSIQLYINHFYPSVIVSGENGLFNVEIRGAKRPENQGNRNNYQISIEGSDKYGNAYKQDKCVTVKDNSAKASFGHDGPDDNTPLTPGTYLIKINEQVNEGVKGGLKTGFDSCNGGFTYWHIGQLFTSNKDKDGNPIKEVILPVSCDPDKKDPDTENERCVKDPNSSDLEAINKLLGIFGETNTLKLLCNKYETSPDSGEAQCLEINTAIGTIPTNPVAFIQKLFTIVLSVAGMAALGIIIYGGYVYMISRGDPERIKGARETITSAIIGLLFIVFSLVILQVITSDIIKIPGFGA